VDKNVELIAPAGDIACARAAVANGADAVYFGLPQFNARMRAENFTPQQIPELVRFLHAHGVKAYAAFNVLVFTDELPAAERQLIELDQAGVDAVIVQDIGLARLAQELGLRAEIHASTQMTITSQEGLKFVSRLGVKRAILARELAIPEIAKCLTCHSERSEEPHKQHTSSALDSEALRFAQGDNIGIEVFVHGALCVAYSGQCLTSEALGQRSANRGECASACRLPYQLIVDGALKDLGDRRYLLSPQDLAAVNEIPELIRMGVTGFKIEGRLKTPEYVAATCQVYRKAIDAATVTQDDLYKLEMVFSRGFHTGWLHGVNHQKLVPARFGTKRGPLVGTIRNVGYDCVEVLPRIPLKPGDGIVFDTGSDNEQGGRIWEIKENRLYFQRGHIDFKKLKPGDRVWKTSDMQLERELKRTYTGEIPRPKQTLDFVVSGTAGKPLTIEAHGVRVHSAMPLQTAFKRPLTTPALRDQLGRLGETDFELGEVENRLVGQVILPVSELNRMRREICDKLEEQETEDRRQETEDRQPVLAKLMPKHGAATERKTEMVVLCRTMEQLSAAIEAGAGTVYLDFEDLRRYADAVTLARSNASRSTIFLATPRIQKPGEQGFFKVVEQAQPDGVLIRNLGGLDYFKDSRLRKVGDFSLNVSNPLTAELLIEAGLERVTVSYDLNAQQVADLLKAAPPGWFELVIHQHMPMFHMDHCVFAAFLSTGTDHTNCGRPCDVHQVRLRDRVGVEHPVKADVGCRNTVFHAKAQTGADYVKEFLGAGARVFRVELLDEDAGQTRTLIQGYRQVLECGDPEVLMRQMNAVRQLGVTSGTLTVLG
jgi:putative protease